MKDKFTEIREALSAIIERGKMQGAPWFQDGLRDVLKRVDELLELPALAGPFVTGANPTPPSNSLHVSMLEGEITDLKKQLEELNADCDKGEEALSIIWRALGGTGDRVRHSDIIEAASGIHKAFSGKAGALTIAQEELSKQSLELVTVKAELASKSQALQWSNTTNADLHAKCDDLRQICGLTDPKIQMDNVALIRHAVKELANYRAECERLRKRISDLGADFNRIRDERNDLSEKCKALESEATIDHLRTQLAERTAERDGWTKRAELNEAESQSYFTSWNACAAELEETGKLRDMAALKAIKLGLKLKSASKLVAWYKREQEFLQDVLTGKCDDISKLEARLADMTQACQTNIMEAASDRRKAHINDIVASASLRVVDELAQALINFRTIALAGE